METNEIERIRQLLEFLVKEKVTQKIENFGNREKKIYNLTGIEGINVKNIAKKVGCSVGKVSGLWKRWESEGILLKKGKNYQKLV